MVFPLNSNKDISFPYESNRVNSGTLLPVLTAANVVSKMGATSDLCTNTIYAKDDLKLYVSKDVMKSFMKHILDVIN